MVKERGHSGHGYGFAVASPSPPRPPRPPPCPPRRPGCPRWSRPPCPRPWSPLLRVCPRRCPRGDDGLRPVLTDQDEPGLPLLLVRGGVLQGREVRRRRGVRGGQVRSEENAGHGALNQLG
ncbi:hypothetical protein F3K40_15105 [Streptomyces sp. LBUM 1478]|nr:hypothetical protein [Streptomyces sp. LBUM 1478]